MPQEIRNPRSERLDVDDVLGKHSGFWGWGSNPADSKMVLQDEGRMPRQDLMERTARFSEAIIRFAKFFLRMTGISEEGSKDEARKLWRENKELNLIFGAIWRK